MAQYGLFFCFTLISILFLYHRLVSGQTNGHTTQQPVINEILDDAIQQEIDKRVEEKVNQVMNAKIYESLQEAIDKGHFISVLQHKELKEKYVSQEKRLKSLEQKFVRVYDQLAKIQQCNPCDTTETTKIVNQTNVTPTETTISTHTPTLVTPEKSQKMLLNPTIELDLSKKNDNIRGEMFHISALSDGGAVLHNQHENKAYIWRINQQGGIVRLLYSCYRCSLITGLIARKSNLIIVISNGTLIQTNLESGKMERIYNVKDVDAVWQSSAVIQGDPDLLLLADGGKGEIFKYRLSSGAKDIIVNRGLDYPSAVYEDKNKNQTIYVICDNGDNSIRVYYSEWGLLKKTRSGMMANPYTVIPSLEDHILVSNVNNNRISMYDYTSLGLLGHIFNVTYPRFLSIKYPYLWVSTISNVYRVKLYKD